MVRNTKAVPFLNFHSLPNPPAFTLPHGSSDQLVTWSSEKGHKPFLPFFLSFFSFFLPTYFPTILPSFHLSFLISFSLPTYSPTIFPSFLPSIFFFLLFSLAPSLPLSSTTRALDVPSFHRYVIKPADVRREIWPPPYLSVHPRHSLLRKTLSIT